MTMPYSSWGKKSYCKKVTIPFFAGPLRVEKVSILWVTPSTVLVCQLNTEPTHKCCWDKTKKGQNTMLFCARAWVEVLSFQSYQKKIPKITMNVESTAFIRLITRHQDARWVCLSLLISVLTLGNGRPKWESPVRFWTISPQNNLKLYLCRSKLLIWNNS